MAEILIIEDEPGVQLTLEDRLRAEGYGVTIRDDGIRGENEALKGTYSLILLDLMLPGRDGFTICLNLRKAGIKTPILMLTARDTNLDTVMGLKVGADDYLAKPFDMSVLLARIEALLRRSKENGENLASEKQLEQVIFGEFILDLKTGNLEKSGEQISLNAQEYRLLEYLAVNSGRILSRDLILDDVWGYGSETSTRTVDVHVAKLRSKLGEPEIPRHIKTFRGRGYRFDL